MKRKKYMKNIECSNEKYMKKCDVSINITFLHVFLIFLGVWSRKSISCGNSLDGELQHKCIASLPYLGLIIVIL